MASLVPFPSTNWSVLQLFAFAAVFLCCQTLAESPPKVKDVTVTKLPGSVQVLDVTWSVVSGSNITYTVCYSVKIGTNNAPPTNQSNCGKSGIKGQYVRLYPLRGNTTYYIWVRAESSGIKGPFSNRTMKTTYKVIPVGTRPEIVSTYSNMITVKWYYIGDYDVYTVYYHRNITHTVTTTSLSYNITGLDSNTAYKVAVSATNSETFAYFEKVVGYTTPESPVLDTPTPRSSTSINLQWSPPPNSDRLPLTYHVNYSSPLTGQNSTTTSYTTLTLTGLHPYEEYTISVQAGNKGGLSVPVNGTARTYSDNAPPPSNVSASPMSQRGKIKVSWTPPTPPTGSSLTGYSIQYRMGDSGSYMTVSDPGGSATSTIVSNLQVGTQYQVRVAAKTELGVGTNSYGTTQVTTFNVPDQVPNLAVQPSELSNGLISLNVTWDEPHSDVNITRYEGNYRKRPSGSWKKYFSRSSKKRQRVYKNLMSGVDYEVRVRAVSPIGAGEYRTATAKLPATPVVQTSTTTTSLYLQWTRSGGDNFTLYYWKTSTPSDVSTATTTSLSYNITGLDSNTAYKVIVSARNVLGSSNSSEVKGCTTPEAPGLVTQTPLSSTSINVQWSPPPNSDRSRLTYHVNYSSPLTGQNSTTTSNTTLTLTGLHPYEEYTISVQAGNEGGLSVPVTGTARTYSDRTKPVSGLTYNVISESSVNISWSEPDKANGIIVGYSVRYGEFEENAGKYRTPSNHTSTNDTHFTLEGLVRYIPYKVTVSARTSVGEGEPSSVVFFTLEGVPTKPVENLTVFFRGSDEVLVSWNPLLLAEARGFPIYIVSYTPASCPGGGSVNTANSSVVFTEVEPCMSYVFSVQVTTGNGTNKGPTANVTMTLSPKEPGDNLALYAVLGCAIVAVVVIVVAMVCVTAILIRKRRLRKKPHSATCEVDMEKKDGSEYPMSHLGPEASVPVFDKDDESIADVSLDESSHERNIEKSRFIEATNQLHLNRNNGFEEEYKTIVNDPNGSDVIAKENRHKNRYINICTYDHSRVILSVLDASGSDYINASYIHGFRRKNAYISTQGPTTNTIADFWQMVWDQRCPVIVMLTKIEEKGKKKCERYWNEDVDDSLGPGRDLSVRVTSIKGYANYVVREITLTNNSDAQSCPHKLKHFHYIAWPDHGVPSHPYSLVKFVQQVRKEYKDSTAPMVVHCSAGVGRTGTFITIDAMMERLKEKDDLNIYQFVTEMRSRRTFMVQTMEQYTFVHDALCDYLTCGDTSIPAYQLRGEMEEMEKVDNDTRMSGFESQFKLLDSVSKKPASEDETFSKKKIVEKKNRYKDRFPYCANHLCVAGKGSTSGGDYFNGTLMDSYSTKKAFIAAQAPLESTVNDVWEMIWQFNPSTIVLLCDFEEGKETTCTPFWPDYHSRVMDFRFHQVNHKETTRRDGCYDFITLEIFDRRKESGRVKELTIHHLKKWSKNRHPPLEVFLRVMGDVERAMKSTPEKVSPAMVMCDDGMARSGVFICAMSEVERVKVEGQVDVFQTIKGMRIQRPHMVDTPDQYKLCFDILQSYLDSFDTYANFKTV